MKMRQKPVSCSPSESCLQKKQMKRRLFLVFIAENLTLELQNNQLPLYFARNKKMVRKIGDL
jgi:hypothetical protein